MTEAFFTALRARLTELVEDLRFTHKPTDTQIAPQIIDLMLERPTTATVEGDEYPYVRWMVFAGEFDKSHPVQFSLLLDGGIYTDGSQADGMSGIASLCLALGKISEVPRFAGYRLFEPLKFTIGAPDEQATGNPGLQPHPYYHCRLIGTFQIPGRTGT